MGLHTDSCSPSPKPDFKPLKARPVINHAIEFARKIPSDLYSQVLAHAK